MKRPIEHSSETTPAAPPPLYERVHNGLHRLIERQMLPIGFVLLEGPIADYFGVSRVPVRRALVELAQAGLIHKFRGRGYLVDPHGSKPAPLRIDFRSLGLPGSLANAWGSRRHYTWQRRYDDIAGDIARCLPFGTYRIRESGICERYNISRTVVREVLTRLMTRGLIDKDQRSHWICGPFTARSNDEQYGMRMILEPAALIEVVGRDHRLDFKAMLARLEQARRQSRPLSLKQIASFELDLHMALPDACTNARLRSAIVQNQLPLNINRTFYSHFGATHDEPLLDEHEHVLSALIAGQPEKAAAALADHLDAARQRSRARLKVLAVVAEPDLPEFLERVH